MGKYPLVFLLTLLYLFIELAGGFYYNSLALITDGAFMAINLVGQVVAIYSKRLSTKPPDHNNTFGYARVKVITGLFHGILVGFMIFYVMVNAYNRILNPELLDAHRVLFIAIIGLLVNGFGAYQLYEESGDIGVRGSYLLILNDTLSSVGVIISSIIISFTGYYIVDSLTSVFITLLVVYPSYFLFRDSLHILMEGIPSGIDVNSVENFIYSNFENVKKIKELHIWSIVPEKNIMTVKIRTDERTYDRDKIKNLKDLIKRNYKINDVFVEVYEEE